MIYLQLFFEFFKTGLFAVGGGMATLPFLYDMAERTGWFTAAQIADMLAVSESTPVPSASTWPPMWASSPVVCRALWLPRWVWWLRL